MYVALRTVRQQQAEPLLVPPGLLHVALAVRHDSGPVLGVHPQRSLVERRCLKRRFQAE